MTNCYFADYTIGADAYKEIEKVCAPLGHRALIIGGETALAKSREKLIKNLGDFEIVDTVIYGRECYRKRIEELHNKYKDSGADFVIGVGGGKAIDTSKCVADMLKVPVVTVPTIASTCAASSALAVIYDENHTYEGFWQLPRPAYHCFIDTEIIVNAPDMYFRAGIGDTLAKFYEVEFSARGRKTTFKDDLGISISRMSREPLMCRAVQAYADCRNHVITADVEETALIILVSTGMVSMLIDEGFNGAMAHALFYGLTVLSGFEEKFLHGDVVGYCTIVQCMLDGDIEEAKKIRQLISELGVQTTLSERGIAVNYDALLPVLKAAISDPDMRVIPYKITPEMMIEAIAKVEEL